MLSEHTDLRLLTAGVTRVLQKPTSILWSSSMADRNALFQITPFYQPTFFFLHYNVYTKSHTNFHRDAFRSLLMPSSGSLLQFSSQHIYVYRVVSASALSDYKHLLTVCCETLLLMSQTHDFKTPLKIKCYTHRNSV